MKPVIIGSGLAGLSAALALAPMPVTLISPCALGEGCSSAWAQGGIAAAVGEGDGAASHTCDTLAVGGGLNDASIVQQTTGDGIKVIERLVAQGVPFDREANGVLRLRLEAAHSKRRIVHVKDGTGFAVMQALIRMARAAPSIDIVEDAQALDLIVNDGVIAGVVLRIQERQIVLQTDCVVLATGGAAGLWRETTNPHQNWGKGLALAARAGATLGDLEFMQFHPTAIDIGRDPMPLASEALRGEGSTLITESGARFTEELQARDIVTRAIFDQIAKGHRVFLDARQAVGDQFPKRFPTIYGLCASAGIDPSLEPIPIRPAAHYHMGGVLTDAKGRTDVPGLWACGEVACTGLHGANRLASNSLLEAASFGWRVAEDIKSMPHSIAPKAFPEALRPLPSSTQEERNTMRAILSDNVGVIRDRTGLQRAISALSPLAKKSDMALVGFMIALCALRREESRGAHYRSDFPLANREALRTKFRLDDIAEGTQKDLFLALFGSNAQENFKCR